MSAGRPAAPPGSSPPPPTLPPTPATCASGRSRRGAAGASRAARGGAGPLSEPEGRERPEGKGPLAFPGVLRGQEAGSPSSATVGEATGAKGLGGDSRLPQEVALPSQS